MDKQAYMHARLCTSIRASARTHPQKYLLFIVLHDNNDSRTRHKVTLYVHYLSSLITIHQTFRVIRVLDYPRFPGSALPRVNGTRCCTILKPQKCKTIRQSHNFGTSTNPVTSLCTNIYLHTRSCMMSARRQSLYNVNTCISYQWSSLTTESYNYCLPSCISQQCTYNVTLRRVRVTTGAMDKQEVLHIPNVCL